MTMAGTTSPLAFPYPTGTDRVMDGDNAMQALAEKVDDFLSPTGIITPVGLAGTQNGWIASGTKLVRMGPLVVMCLNGSKTSWGGSEGIGNVPAGYVPATNVYAIVASANTGAPTGVYVRGGDGVIIAIAAVSNGGGILGQICWYIG